MDTTLAVLMALGIFVVIPAAIGFAIAGIFILSDRRAWRAKRAETAAGAKVEELVQLESEAPVEHEAAEPAERTLVGTH